MLTRKQHELLTFIHGRLGEAGVSPSFEEMKDALDLKSKSGVHRLITALEERGFIRRLPNRARALEVVKMPELSGAGGGNVVPLRTAAPASATSKSRPPFAGPAMPSSNRWTRAITAISRSAGSGSRRARRSRNHPHSRPRSPPAHRRAIPA